MLRLYCVKQYSKAFMALPIREAPTVKDQIKDTYKNGKINSASREVQNYKAVSIRFDVKFIAYLDPQKNSSNLDKT